MKQRVKLAVLVILTVSLAITRAACQYSAQNAQTPQQMEKPPHVDAEPDPAARDLERSIMDTLKQDPHMAYSRVSVHATDKEVVLNGFVLTATAKNQAAQIAADHAGGRKVKNKLRVNPNTHPGPGF
jgi:osmotically-inducible protein OsmY